MEVGDENLISYNKENSPEPTKDESKEIHPINKETIHRICSGQVVLSLAVAVKELVENSIDAGATVIEVKLKEHGLEYVEVSDNGSGVEEKNLEAMTAKYHTSKLREFTDLTSIETFGFRGEALSSLCALSDMKVVTKYKTAEVGVRIELNHEGKIKSKTICPREIGTTVTLSNLFSTLPVRKREFQKNIKKEFAKMCQILQAYCMISKNIKIICSNITDKGRKNIFLSTQGSESILDNISAVFGSKQTSELIALKPPIDQGAKFSEDSFTEIQDVSNSSMQVTLEDLEKLNSIDFEIEGYISSCSHGSGRGAKDRQYFFINSRPCDHRNLAKLVNEIYHRYNVNQYPFVFLNLKLKRTDVDINVTPDKRQLLVNNEKILLLAVKKSLINTFGNIPSTYKVQNSTLHDFKIEKISSVTNHDEDLTVQIPSTQSFMEKLSQWKHTGSTDVTIKPVLSKRKAKDEIQQRTEKMRKIQEFLSQQPTFSEVEEKYASYQSDNEGSDKEEGTKNTSDLNISFNISNLKKEAAEYEVLLNQSESIKEFEKRINIANENDNYLFTPPEELVCQISCKNIEDTNFKNLKIIKNDYGEDCSIDSNQSTYKSSQDSVISIKEKILTIELDGNESDASIPKNDNFSLETEMKIETSIDTIRKLTLVEEEYINSLNAKLNFSRLKFKTGINPSKNKTAEEELEKEIHKEMFSRMEICGQFNQGFIIVKLEDDLFIVDQHASDEKYNFEDLQKTVVIQSQALTIPERLELTAVDEMMVIDNLKIFESNGFKIEIDENAPPTRKLKLLAKPFSKNWQFGKEDISDLLFMLQDAPPDTLVRPSKVRAMFASRACRKSIMIGDTLNQATMRRLINHMGEIEHPWNCPHGRPTMRHLINLTMIESQQSDEK